ncbi:hypothetical protein [Larkinella terrae]|uniref:Uncharacterized protein n=1 Tax=Larkinella terrae TaxID=2025311 RepID=A0A7K0ESJ1_9BACT|nr:hypothetical protein [Larkinella terrae]MRS64739.1 hypothetical protein [Larkinella terrae]
MSTLTEWVIRLTSLALVYACSFCKEESKLSAAKPHFIVVKGSGDITPELTMFREILGAHLNTTPGQKAGRREINWDVVPASQLNVNSFRGDFFNKVSGSETSGFPYGAVFTTVGTGLRVSDNGFGDLIATCKNRYNALRSGRTFSPIGSTILDVTFYLPGQTIPASVRGFGVIFYGVDQAGSTTLEFFDGETSLGTFQAPVRTDPDGLSFLGVKFPDHQVSRVRITAGDAAVSKTHADESKYDLVVLDDLLYDEPQVL